jgi:hypothetical protein
MLLVLCGMCAVKACPGVCVAERIADYCEAVLDISELCKSGLRCCVSRDSYADGELPPNLVLMDRNASRPTSGEKLSCKFLFFLQATGRPSAAPRSHSCMWMWAQQTVSKAHSWKWPGYQQDKWTTGQLDSRHWISICGQTYFSLSQHSNFFWRSTKRQGKVAEAWSWQLVSLSSKAKNVWSCTALFLASSCKDN